MKQKILFVSNEPSEFDNTRECLRRHLKNDFRELEVEWEKNILNALKCLRKKSFQLIIADLFIAQDSDSAVVEDLKGGIKLLNDIKELKIPSILVVPAKTNELQNEVDDLDHCRMVVKGSTYDINLVKFIRKFLQRTPSKIEKSGYINLILDLTQKLWQYQILGEFGDRNYCDQGLLEIRSDEMEKLINRSCRIGKNDCWDCWEEDLREIGDTLFREIIQNNYKFSRSFHKLIDQIKDKNNIKIRFSVERTIHPLLLEALVEDNVFIMLNSPVYRSLSVSGEYPLFIDPSKGRRHPINCLIIESPVGDTIVPEVDETRFFPLLNKISEETKWLEEFLLKHQTEFNIGRILRIHEPPKNEYYLNYLEREITKNSWQFVHYSGHSFYQNDKKADNYGNGYLLFPGETIPTALSLKRFSKWLRDCETEFVYLSSCHSFEGNFVFELAEHFIPVIIGFRWDADDAQAFDFAKQFYTHLFQDKSSIEKAFLQTRKDMYRDYPNELIWASPMLIMQGSEILASA